MVNVQTNSAISVDCVIFGFDGVNLKALLVRRRASDPLYDDNELKLPGAMRCPLPVPDVEVWMIS